MSADVVEVVAGIVRDGERLLVTQRPRNKHLGGLWEFPGGKIEVGEHATQALARELEEELGITVEVGELRFDVTHAYPEKTVRIRFYDCRLLRGEVQHLGVDDHRWMLPEDLHELHFPDADRALLRELATPRD